MSDRCIECGGRRSTGQFGLCGDCRAARRQRVYSSLGGSSDSAGGENDRHEENGRNGRGDDSDGSTQATLGEWG